MKTRYENKNLSGTCVKFCHEGGAINSAREKRRCPVCLAEVPKDLTKCPKCGASVPLPVQDKVLRSAVKFSFIVPVYSKPNLIFNDAGELERVETEFRLYKAVREPAQPPFILYDSDGYINIKRHEYSLQKLDQDTLLSLEEAIPKSVWKKVMKKHNIGFDEDEEDDDASLAYRLWRAGFLVTPVPRLRDVNFLKKMNWREFVEDIIDYKRVQIDPRLRLVRLTHLMRGLKQAINPHATIVLPGQTGKSEWYKHVGVCEDKVGANSLIGYADADGPKPGSLDGSEVPFAIDQLESSGMFLIFRYLLGLLEFGEARVDMAAYPFDIHCLSPVAIISNPLGDPKSTFAVLIEKMSKNPSLGRRFGILLYDKKAVRIKRREKDLDVIKEKVALFRAVEEFALPEIKKIINTEEVWAWLNKRNEEWINQALKLIKTVQPENENLYLFLREFIENGGTHTRGGALRAALTMNLDKIALKEYNLADILSEAEEYLHELLKINYSSIQKIAAVYKETMEEAALRLFDTLPIYMKEITSAIEHWRRSLSEEKRASMSKRKPLNIPLSTLNYTPQTQPYFSRVIDSAKKGNPEKHNESLKAHFGFELKKEGKDVIAVIYSLDKMPFLKLFGNFGSFGNFEELGEKKFSGDKKGKEETDETKTLNPKDEWIHKQCRFFNPETCVKYSYAPDGSCRNCPHYSEIIREIHKPPEEENSLPKLFENSENNENSEKEGGEEKVNKEKKIGVTCGSCEFFHTKKCVMERPDLIQPYATYAESCPNYRPRSDYP